DEQDHIWLECLDICFTEGYIFKNSAKVLEYFHQAHKGEFPIVFYNIGSRGVHQVTTPGPYPGFRIFLLQCLDQVGRMQVSACLTCYDIIFHLDQIEHSLNYFPVNFIAPAPFIEVIEGGPEPIPG